MEACTLEDRFAFFCIDGGGGGGVLLFSSSKNSSSLSDCSFFLFFPDIFFFLWFLNSFGLVSRENFCFNKVI